MKILKLIFADWLVGLLLTLFILGATLISWYPLESIEYKTYDFRAKLRQGRPESPIVIVAIDDDSITKIGRWPWPRTVMADMVDKLKGYGAKIIGVNVLYTEKDLNSGLLEIRDIKAKAAAVPALGGNAELKAMLEDSEKRLDSDSRLQKSISEAGNVVLPLYFNLGRQLGGEGEEMPAFLTANSIDDPMPGSTISASGVFSPIEEFSSNAIALGHINLAPDSDGSIRSEPLFINFREKLFPSFSLHLVLKQMGQNIENVEIGDTLKAGGLSVTTDAGQRLFINYMGPTGTFEYFPFFDVRENKVPESVFKGKIVLIGHTAQGIATFGETPMGTNFPLIEINATVIDNLLTMNFITRPTWAFFAEFGAIILFGVFIAVLMPRLKAKLSAFITAGLLLLWNGAAIYLFVANGYWVYMFAPSLLLGLGYTLITTKRYFITERSKDIVEADSVETNKMLGLSFQAQGMLDMAFEKLRKCPIEDTSVKDILYNLALDFERKRMFNKAVSIYDHILTAGPFKDIEERKKTLKVAEETVIFGGPARKDATVLSGGGASKPTLGRYEITKELGRGAMGTVYLGKDPKINREVAIKTMRYDEVDEEQLAQFKERFFREAEAAGTLSHPNIVTIYDAGEDYDVAYVAMELLDGTELTPYCAKDKRLPLKETLRIIRSVADALDYAHKKGVVHRDIKPANIMLLKNGVAKVTDFGIARVMASSKTQTGVVLGTPSYMSPEQVVGKKVDGRSDLFSLGGVMYEMLTARKPFTGDSIGTLMYNIANKPPVMVKQILPKLPDCVAYITHRLLTKDLTKRYPNGAEVVKHIDVCLKKIGG